MRKTFIVLFVGLLAAVCIAAPRGVLTSTEILKLTDVSKGSYTQAVDSVTSDGKIRGYVEMIHIQVSGVNTVDVDIVTSNVVDSGWAERTLYSADNITANSTFVTNGAALRYIMYDEKVTLKSYAATITNSTVKATVIYATE